MRESLPLIVTIKVKGVNIHYYSYWGAFTMNAIDSGKELLKIYEEEKYAESSLDPEIIGYDLFYLLRINTFTDWSWRAISHAGLTETAYQYMSAKYPEYDFVLENDRVAGYIYLDIENKVDDFSVLQKMHNIPTDSFTIDFDKKSINFGLFQIYDYDDYAKDTDIADLSTLPTIDFDFKNLSFEEFKTLEDVLCKVEVFIHNENNKRYIYSQIVN